MAGTMGSMHQSLSSLSGAMASAVAQAGSQAEAALAAFEQQYCKPATFTPSEHGRDGETEGVSCKENRPGAPGLPHGAPPCWSPHCCHSNSTHPPTLPQA